MKAKEFKDLRAKDIKSLKKMVYQKRLEIMKKNMAFFGGKEKNLKLVGTYRHELAKILTLIREKEILAEIEKGKEQKV